MKGALVHLFKLIHAVQKVGPSSHYPTVTLCSLLVVAAELDYVMQFDEVQFSPSDTQKEVTLVIVDNDELEDTEMFFLTLNFGQGATADQNSFADAVILDNDNVSIQLSIETCALTVAESARFVEVTVTKLGLSSIPVEVMLQTQDGTAIGTYIFTCTSYIKELHEHKVNVSGMTVMCYY